jgi:hypothetical protein
MDFTRRFEKIMKIIHEISTWDMEKCHSVTKDMTDILIHNFNVMVSNKNMIKLYDFLGTYSSENTVSLI